MSSTYFGNFPLITYTLDPAATQTTDIVTNLFRRVAFTNTLLNQAQVFYPYQIRDSDTPENIAHRYYNDPQYFWLVTLMNQINDPILDWPLNTQNFTKMIETKYGSVANAQSQVAYYVMQVHTNSSNGDSATRTTVIDSLAYQQQGLPITSWVDPFQRTELGEDYRILTGHMVNLSDPIAGLMISHTHLSTTGSGAALLSHDMPSNQYLEATLAQPSNTGILTLGVRCDITHDKLSGYFVDITANGSSLTLYRYQEFDWVSQTGSSQLNTIVYNANSMVSFGTGDTYRLTAFNNVLSVAKNNRILLTYTDNTTLMGTKGGVILQGAPQLSTLTIGPQGLLPYTDDFLAGVYNQSPSDHPTIQSATTNVRYWLDGTLIFSANSLGLIVSGTNTSPKVTTVSSNVAYGLMIANTGLSPDHYATVTVGTCIAANPSYLQLAVRGTANLTANLWSGYDYQITPNGSFSLYKSINANGINGNSQTIITGVVSPFGQLAPGTVLTVTAIGSTIAYYRDSRLEYAYTDPSPLSGIAAGFGMHNGTPYAPVLNFYLTTAGVAPILANTVYQFPQVTANLASQATEVNGRVYTFPDGSTVTTTIDTGTVNCYDAEVLNNERKRTIKLLKKEYVLQARAELDALTGGV